MCRRLIAAWVSILVLGELHPARAQEAAVAPATESIAAESGLDALGSYERSALLFALEERGLELEEAPEGKVLRSEEHTG